MEWSDLFRGTLWWLAIASCVTAALLTVANLSA